MPRYVQDIDRGMKRIMRELQKAKVSEVVIGLQQGDKNAEGADIATYAAYNEYGTSKIPERSFMRTTFDERANGLQNDLRRQFGMVMDGTKSTFQALSYVGLKHQDQIKEKIVTLKSPPNSPATIAKKGSANPLIDTGAMVANVRYIVRASRGNQ